MVNRLAILTAAVAMAFASPVWAADTGASGTPQDLSALMSMQSTSGSEAAVKAPFADLRDRALREAAEAIGAQHGMIWESDRINAEIQAQSRALDRIYDFSSLMLGHGMVVPPVIEQAQSEWTGNAEAARRVDVQYKIIEQARIAPVPPNWRNWLLMPPMQALKPDPALLPRTAAERALWSSSVQSGWKAGVGQADTTFNINLHRLQRDITGMMLFLRLERQGVVSLPVIGQGRPTIEVSGRSLAIGQTLFRIEAGSQFNGASYWDTHAAGAPVLPDLGTLGAGTMPTYPQRQAHDVSMGVAR